MRWGHWLTITVMSILVSGAAAGADGLLDDFETLRGWTATATGGVRVALAQDPGRAGGAMRIDFDFAGGGGHVLVRKAFDLALPENYAFTFGLRGAAPPVDFELKLIDRADDNVWWYRERDMTLPAEWRTLRVKPARLEFAWGPAGGGPPAQIAFLEFAVTGSPGDTGSLWIDDLRLEPRPAKERNPGPPRASASSEQPGHAAALAVDDDPATVWRSAARPAEQSLQLDFGQPREYGGLTIEWDARDYATAYAVEASDDGEHWTRLSETAHGNGRRDDLYLPDGESRFLRLALQRSSQGDGYAVRAVRVTPLDLALSPNQFFAGLARQARAGDYPKYFLDRQTYWTVAGAPNEPREALINEEGMVEVDKGGFSIEPFLFAEGALVTWNDVVASQSLADGDLPIPSVHWQYGDLGLTITALVAGAPGRSTLLLRYRLANAGGTPAAVRLYLAVRPFQVLPPWQTLNMVGGVAPIADLAFTAPALRVDGTDAVLAVTPPAQFGAAAGDEGPITDFLRAGTLPQRSAVADPAGFASGALAYDLGLAAGGAPADVLLAVPFHEPGGASVLSGAEDAAGGFDRLLAQTKAEWRRRLSVVELRVPPQAAALTAAARTALAHILINRDGPMIQPGSRTYARSWIRDGAMTAAALLEMGFTQEVRDFIRWYAGFQYADGKIPCCIDRRGADPLPEHDSTPEFIYAIAEYYRYTRDVGFVYELWPRVVRGVDYIEGLQAQRRTDAYRSDDRRAYYGLLPESVSHEGYAANPVHSYWDDFFAVRALKDAAALALVLDDQPQAARLAALRDGLRSALHASIRTVIAQGKLPYIPASVELADYDPSSTAIALAPAGEQADLPEPQLSYTFDRYYDELSRRRRGELAWDAYAPYELRSVGALLRLGRRAAALGVLDGLLADRRPLAWNQWPEIVWRDAAAPKFVGDMPHTWIGSGYIEAVRDLFAYEDEPTRSLVLAAGLPFEWLSASPDGVGVARLPTHVGVINYRLRADGPAALRLQLAGDVDVPAGGIVVRPPLPRPLRAASINGAPAAEHSPDSVTVRAVPADVLMEY